jgi:predicted rRNA methylase YqxC with S4 and FtsJ domains
MQLDTEIVLTSGVSEYRRTIPRYVRPDDVVLEIGCAWGTTSARLHRRAARLVAVDKGDSLPEARRQYPEVHFEQLDAFDLGAVHRVCPEADVIYIDISGCRRIQTVVQMVDMYEKAYRPRVMVVKSTQFKGLVSRCTLWGE